MPSEKSCSKTTNYLLIAIISTSLILVILYGFFIEPCQVRLKTVEVHNKALASTFKELKIVLLSDLHIGNSWSTPVKRTLEIVSKLNPDLIFLTGDYVDWKGGNEAYDNAITFLSHLSAPLGVYAVMGDSGYHFSRKSCEFCHESGSALPTTRHQVKFLRNTEVNVNFKTNNFSIIGLDTDSRDKPDLNLINNMRTGNPTIVLSHFSSVYNSINKEENVLVLSGDTHGGQIYLPGIIWKIIRRKPDPAHMYGLFQDRNKSLYVTSGIGTSDIPFRLGMPPEVVLFEFKD